MADCIFGPPGREAKISLGGPICVIGERINPTNRKALARDIAERSFKIVMKDAREQLAAGAHALDVNVSVPGTDEVASMREAVRLIAGEFNVPLVIDTANPEALEAGIKAAGSKVLANSINGETAKLNALLPVIKETGCAVVALCMDDRGIPVEAAERIAVAKKLLTRLDEAGIPDVVIDPLAMTVATDNLNAVRCCRAIAEITGRLKRPCTLGLSNISFGLPARHLTERSFLAMATASGLSSIIANPLAEGLIDAVAACNLLAGWDEFGMGFITRFRGK